MLNHYLEFYCSTGEISHIEAFGIIPENSLLQEACIDNEASNACSSLFDKEQVRKKITDMCKDKKECLIDIKTLITGTAKEECLQDSSIFFMQVYCMHSEHSLHD